MKAVLRILPGFVMAAAILAVLAPGLAHASTQLKECRIVATFDELSKGQQRLLNQRAVILRMRNAGLTKDFDGKAFWASIEADNSQQATFWAVTDALEQIPIGGGETALDLVKELRAIRGSIPSISPARQFHIEVIWRSDALERIKAPDDPAHFKDRPSAYHGKEKGLQQSSKGYTGVHVLFGRTLSSGIRGEVHVDYRPTSSVGAVVHVMDLDLILEKVGLGAYIPAEGHYAARNGDPCAIGPEKDFRGRVLNNAKKHHSLYPGSHILDFVLDPAGVAAPK